MSASPDAASFTPLILDAATAADLMEPKPASVRDSATVAEAIRLLTDTGCSAAAVFNQANQLIGVLSRADILVHDRERREYSSGSRGETENQDPTLVSEVMTPAVFSVTPATPASRVIEEMVAMKVHQLFVVDSAGSLIGVISAFDILRHLHPPFERSPSPEPAMAHAGR
jgi:CBS domain-containing protein